MSKPLKILWDDNAKADLKLIFDFIKLKLPRRAKNIVAEIINQTKEIRFTRQY